MIAVRRAAHLLIRAYQLTISALIGRHCRHLPSCSDYTDAAIQRHGFWAGGWMGLARLSRCRPWGSCGYDPVPDRSPPAAHWWAPWRFGDWRGRSGIGDVIGARSVFLDVAFRHRQANARGNGEAAEQSQPLQGPRVTEQSQAARENGEAAEQSQPQKGPRVTEQSRPAQGTAK